MKGKKFSDWKKLMFEPHQVRMLRSSLGTASLVWFCICGDTKRDLIPRVFDGILSHELDGSELDFISFRGTQKSKRNMTKKFEVDFCCFRNSVCQMVVLAMILLILNIVVVSSRSIVVSI